LLAAATVVVSEQSLKLLKCATAFVSVPGVNAAADAALSILALAQVGSMFISFGNANLTLAIDS
jgi:hypothetical protein